MIDLCNIDFYKILTDFSMIYIQTCGLLQQLAPFQTQKCSYLISQLHLLCCITVLITVLNIPHSTVSQQCNAAIDTLNIFNSTLLGVWGLKCPLLIFL